MKIKLKSHIDFEKLEMLDFKKNEHAPSRIEGLYDYTYENLRVCIDDREVLISSGFDPVSGNKELIKFIVLYLNGYLELEV